MLLNSVEVRVLGSLIEKQAVTPEYYPLTLNALINACNQLTNRDPVVSYDEQTVFAALNSLRAKQLLRVIRSVDARVPKYEQVFTEFFSLSPQDAAVMCVLMLRGPQTSGEIRARAGRLYDFKDLAEAEQTAEGLTTRKPQPLAVKLERQRGARESRYMHLLSGEPKVEEKESRLQPDTITADAPAVAPAVAPAEDERIAKLEAEIELLKKEIDELKRRFDDFKKQFE